MKTPAMEIIGGARRDFLRGAGLGAAAAVAAVAARATRQPERDAHDDDPLLPLPHGALL